MNVMSSGTKLKLLRELFGMSQGELAKRIGSSQSQISLIEKEIAPDETIVKVTKEIEAALGVSLDDPRFEVFASIVHSRQPIAV